MMPGAGDESSQPSYAFQSELCTQPETPLKGASPSPPPGKRGRAQIIKEGLEKKRQKERLFELVASGRRDALDEISDLVKKDPAR